MRIAEIFRSVQGEGLLTGVESIFVRASGCNLHCGYCDTPYASWKPEGEDLSIADILERIEQLRDTEPPEYLAELFDAGSVSLTASPVLHHVVLTGGEPMLFAELEPLSNQLHDAGWHVTIETSGTRYLPVACDLMSISPKLSNSAPTAEDAVLARHLQQRHAPEVIRRLTAEYAYQIKFVVGRIEDCLEIDGYLSEFPKIRHERVMLMPLGVQPKELADRAAWLEPYCVERGFRFCPRKHIEWFGSERGR